MASVGTFTLIKNESRWIRPHLLSWLPHVNQMVFFDGNSTDGTLELIEDLKLNHPFGNRITLVKDKDPKDLDQDYQRVFNECLRSLTTNYAIFAHPDMILEDPGNIGFLGDAVAYTTRMRSFAGETGGQLLEVLGGRSDVWKNVYQLNPDLGLHYYGAYGSADEDCYFSEITGEHHELYADIGDYPYEVKDSGIKILHYSDVRTLERRFDRMYKCLLNQGKKEYLAGAIAMEHPRVTFKDGHGFKFVPAEYPAEFFPEFSKVAA